MSNNELHHDIVKSWNKRAYDCYIGGYSCWATSIGEPLDYVHICSVGRISKMSWWSGAVYYYPGLSTAYTLQEYLKILKLSAFQ